MFERLFSAIDERRDDLVAMTADLIRFPTVNPPGEAYRPCAEYVGERLRKAGFGIEYIRGEGTPGDTDRYPRVNVVARFDGRAPGPCVHFNSHIDVVEAGDGWTLDPFAGIVKDGRVYGRGACDMKGGLAASIIAVEAFMATWPDFRHRGRGVRRLRRRRSPGEARLLLQTEGRPRHHPRASQQGPHLPRPSRRMVGRNRNHGRDCAWFNALPWRQCRAPYGRGAC